MSAATTEPTAAELQTAIHALHNIFDAIWLVMHENGSVDDRAAEIRDGLLLAGKQITTDLRRRF